MAKKRHNSEIIAAEVADNAQNNIVEDNELEFSSGVVLRIKPVTPLVVMDIAKRHKKPSIPNFFNEDHGRNEENPSDPMYIADMEEYNNKITSTIIDAFIVMGTEVVSIPKDMQKIEDNDWVDMLSSIGIDIDSENKKVRYILWVKYVALPKESDLDFLTTEISALAGVSNTEVAEAEDSFRGDAE